MASRARKLWSGRVGHLLNGSARHCRCASINQTLNLPNASTRHLSLHVRAGGGRSISAQSAITVTNGAGSHASLARFGTVTRDETGELLLQVDAFTDEALRGNPAAVLFTQRNGNAGLGNKVYPHCLPGAVSG